MRAHLVQFDIAWEDKAANHARVRAILENTEIPRGDLVVLPEMFDTGFSLDVERTGVDPERSIAFLRETAAALGSTTIGGITTIGDDGRGRNRAIVAGPQGDVVETYDKIHPFTFGREPERFIGGDRVVTFTWGTGAAALRVCPVVCYDLRFPELFRAGLALGAEMYVVIANWPSARAAHWRALLIARAIENQAWVLGVNRCGSDPHLEYAGGTIAVGPQGDVVGELGGEPGVLSVGVDRGPLEAWRGRFPAWQDAGRVGRITPGTALGTWPGGGNK